MAPTPAELADEASAWAIGGGILTFALFPLVLPIVLLTGVHAAALAAGYEDHGGPGERAVYHPGYYGAFVLDPDGHNVEVVNQNR